MSETPLIQVFGLTVGLNVFLAMVGTIIIVGAVALFLRRRLSVERPGHGQILLEGLVDFIDSIVVDNIGQQADPTYTLVMLTLFIMVFVANMLGLPFLLEGHSQSFWKSPTADPIVAFSLAIIINLISHVLAIRKRGFWSYIKNRYFSPVIACPVVIAEEVLNLITLAMRLFGNIFAGEILLALLAHFGNAWGLFSWLGGIPMIMVWQAFSIFIGVIQAYIFVTLSTVYLKEKVCEEEGE